MRDELFKKASSNLIAIWNNSFPGIHLLLNDILINRNWSEAFWSHTENERQLIMDCYNQQDEDSKETQYNGFCNILKAICTIHLHDNYEELKVKLKLPDWKPEKIEL